MSSWSTCPAHESWRGTSVPRRRDPLRWWAAVWLRLERLSLRGALTLLVAFWLTLAWLLGVR